MMRPSSTRLFRYLGLALLVLAGAGCDAKKPPPPPPPKQQQPPPPPPPAAAAPAAAEATGGDKMIDLTDKDFAEGPANRDPFRSFLAEFNRPKRVAKKTERKIILPRYGLDELKLIAVVSGGTRPVAMFRDPTGLGVTVKRGDYISKNAGKVKHILTDKVVVEIEEQSEDKNTLVDRVIDLHPKEDRQSEEGQ
jgi:type IV pilus assembly protein PilP